MNTPLAQQSSTRSRFTITLMLGALTTISPFAIDMYLPAFQKMADHFSTTPARVSLSLSSYFIGLALGQIAYGPLLDRFGRKRPLYIGLIVFIVASIGCVAARDVESFIAIRFLQALGGCAASVASTAMVRDFFGAHEAAKIFSRLMLILSVSPLFAPTIGGWIVSHWGWHAIFYLLAAIVFIFLLIMFFFLPEGRKPDSSISLNAADIFSTFFSILRDRRFFAFAVGGSFSLAGLFTYLAGSPAIFFDMYHLSENQFGMIFAFLSIGMIGGGQINILLMKRYSSQSIFRTALLIQFFIAIFFLIAAKLNWFEVKGHIATLFLYISCVGLVTPNATAMALAPFEKNSGSAAALLGTLQMGVGALASGLFGILPFQANVSVAVVFLMTSIVAVGVYFKILNTSEPV